MLEASGQLQKGREYAIDGTAAGEPIGKGIPEWRKFKWSREVLKIEYRKIDEKMLQIHPKEKYYGK